MRLLDNIKKYVKHTAWVKTSIKFLITKSLIAQVYGLIYKRKISGEISRVKFPSTISIEVTNACNAHCLMCPREKMTRPIGFMPDDLFRKIVDNAAELKVNRIQLMHYGEPLMDKKLPEKISFVKQRGIMTGIFTNGALLTRKVGEEIIKAGLDELCFSFDAFNRETYERIRKGLEFDVVLRNIDGFLDLRKELQAHKPMVKIVFVASVENYSEVMQFQKKWEKLVDEIEVCTVDNYAGAVSVELPPSKRKFIAKQSFLFPCPQLWKHFVVMWDGRVALCCKDYNGDGVLGDVNENSLQNIWNGSKARSYRDMHIKGHIRALPMCRTCTMHKNNHYFVWWEGEGSVK